MKKNVSLGSIEIGGNNAVSVQSMLNCPSSDFEACQQQIRALKSAGCDIIRLAVLTKRTWRAQKSCLPSLRMCRLSQTYNSTIGLP